VPAHIGLGSVQGHLKCLTGVLAHERTPGAKNIHGFGTGVAGSQTW
jgi:hypothetical protein